MFVCEFVVIGYGFGDKYVNVVFCDWLKIFGIKLIICDLYRIEVLDCLLSNVS